MKKGLPVYNALGIVMVYYHLSPLLHSNNVAREVYSILPFLFNSVIKEILKTTLMEVGNDGVDLLLEKKYF